MSGKKKNEGFSKDNLIGGAEQLSSTELDALIRDILSIRAKRHSAILTKDESELMEIINTTLSSEEFERFQVLVQLRNEEKLSDPEHHELIYLTDRSETLHVARMASLAQLAALKGTSLQAVMKELEIQPAYV